jgi:hypothetical protein
MPKNPVDRFDSVVDDVLKPSIFVSFRDGQSFSMCVIAHLAAAAKQRGKDFDLD